MKIVRFEAENIKRLSAVEITPDGAVIVIGGRNAQGKTSVLDAIAYALGGKALVCAKPLREGQEEGHVSVTLDGDQAADIPPLVVTRTFTAAGTTNLKVTTPNGMKPASPQKLLDSLCSHVAFDPLAFTRLKPIDQAAQLRDLVGLDFSEIDARRKELYDQRTAVNRDAKAAKARLGPAEDFPDAPDEEVSVAALMGELEKAQAQNWVQSDASKKATERDVAAAQIVHEIKRAIVRVEAAKQALAEAEQTLAELTSQREQADADAAQLRAEADAMPTVDCQPIHDRIAASEGVNRQVRAKRARARLAAEVADLEGDAQDLTAEIEKLDAEKRSAMAAADWPVEGLGFDESGVTYKGLPFDQASSAEQLRVAVAVGLALNPRLPVLLIRDGSLLDEENLQLLAEMVSENGGQVWLERVGEGAECAVVIEDGAVKGEADVNNP